MPKLLSIAFLVLAAASSVAATVPVYFRAGDSLVPLVATLQVEPPAAAVGGDDGVLQVLSLNLAHGRSDGVHQLLQLPSERRRTLERIAELLARERPDVVALQEADGPSFWSGGFDHVRRLQNLAGFPYAAHGSHVSGPLLRYGTGLLSSLRLEEPLAVTFDPSPPTLAKGFSLGTVDVGGERIDVVSVHLDFASAAVRGRQVQRMLEVLEGRGRPLVVMGDFNAGWRDPDSAVRRLTEELGLAAYEADAVSGEPGVYTFPGGRARLDWILVSPELSFERYAVLPDVVSDHLAVVADLRVRPR
jgi:endonuclease/exonuclease/phosphatase family metal-dependent hydrolase